MTRKYECYKCGKKFPTVVALGGHRRWCLDESEANTFEAENEYRSSSEAQVALSLASNDITPYVSGVGTEVTTGYTPQELLQRHELEALDDWWAGSTDKALVAQESWMTQKWLGMPKIVWAFIGVIGGLAFVQHLSLVKAPAPGSEVTKVPGLGATASFLPASAMALLGWLFISKLARTEFHGWIQEIENWGNTGKPKKKGKS